MISGDEFSFGVCYFPVGFGGGGGGSAEAKAAAATEACLSCHDATCHFLTSPRDKESRHKALNQIGHTALPITVDNICRLTTKVKLLLRVSAVSNLPVL